MAVLEQFHNSVRFKLSTFYIIDSLMLHYDLYIGQYVFYIAWIDHLRPSRIRSFIGGFCGYFGGVWKISEIEAHGAGYEPGGPG